MDAISPPFFEELVLPTTPQQTLDQADALFNHFSDLRHLNAQRSGLYHPIHERLELLATTAQGLQAIDEQDRQPMQEMLDQLLQEYKTKIAEYERSSSKAAERSQDLKDRVRRGMATVEDLEDIMFEVANRGTPSRSDSSLTSEPESPPSPLTTMAPSKRRRFTSEEGEDGGEERVKRIKHENSPSKTPSTADQDLGAGDRLDGDDEEGGMLEQKERERKA